MNILVYPHELIVGGSQINAIELAAAIRDRGHRVTVTSPPGALVAMINDLGLDYIPMTSSCRSVTDVRHLIRLTQKLQFDLIHTYEWRPSILAAFGPDLLNNTPVLMTILSMEIPYALPKHIPLVVGTRQLADELPHGRTAWLMEPPIDAIKNRPIDAQEARARWSFRDDDMVVAIVCRLTRDLEKLQGVMAAISAVSELAERLPFKLLVVGDGEGLRQVEDAANVVNRRWGRRIVVPTGQMLDPRDAYEASDVVLGMGSSALKGMAFSKPLVVQGTQGFWRLLDDDSLELFLYQGWFGQGGGGADDLKTILLGLADDPDKRLALGRLGRNLVEQRFSLERATSRLLEMYETTIADRSSIAERLPSVARLAVDVAKFRTVQWWNRPRSGRNQP